MKTTRLIVVFMLVTAMIVSFGACQSNTPVTSGSESSAPTEEKPAEGPQYGGTLTYVSSTESAVEPPGWDIHESPSILASLYLSPVEEYLIIGDVLNKGPRGTNQLGFNMYQQEFTEDLLIGNLCESYEVSEDGLLITFKVRPGIMWQANDNIGMKAREFTAEDVAYYINRYRSSSKASKMSGFTDENPATVVDENTVQVQFTKPFASWPWVFAYCLYANVYPKEMVDADPNNWKNVTGTGPFKLFDYVTASQVVYAKNEDWWNKAQVVDGKEYNTPFIDKLVYPIMPDEATRIAALISGKVDIMTNVSTFYEDILKSAAPGLNIVASPSGSALNLHFNTLSGPCADLEFRRALMVGTDEQAITSAIPGAVIGGFPFSYSHGESIYTPVDKMPEDVKHLYDYDPAEAKQKIEQLGYAGATINIYYVTSLQDYVTTAELLADQWKELGLNPVLNAVDDAVFAGYNTGDGSNWDGVLIYNGSNSKTARGIENVRSKQYAACYKDEHFNDLMDTMMAESDAVKREAIMKEASNYFIGLADEIAICETTTLTCWWPWVKNYYGEYNAGGNLNPMLATLWIDQDLKAEMGK